MMRNRFVAPAAGNSAIEGQVFHHVAWRMKRRGAKWSHARGDNLVCLPAADGNGELDGLARDACPAQPVMLEQAGEPEPTRKVSGSSTGPDPAAWLQGSMPDLSGPSASKLWVKYVLHELARSGISVA